MLSFEVEGLEQMRKLTEYYLNLKNPENSQGQLDVDSSTIKCADCGKVIEDVKVPKYCEMMNERSNKFKGKIVCKDCQKEY